MARDSRVRDGCERSAETLALQPATPVYEDYVSELIPPYLGW